MAVEIKRPVSRRTVKPYRTVYVEARPVVVTILPGDVLEFREAGRRQRWVLAIEKAFRYAVYLQAMAALAAKRAAKRQGKAQSR